MAASAATEPAARAHGRGSRRGSRRGPRRVAGALIAALGLLAGCSGAGALGGAQDVQTVTVAIVSNPQMEDAISLAPQFEAEHPGVRLRFVSLSENEARAKITASVATGGGEFDVVMISNYETPQWAANGWIRDLQPTIDATPGYDPADFVPSVRDALSYQGRMYSVPFYGESSFLMYRKDLFDQAGVQMPAQPTWPQVAELAARFDDRARGGSRAGICLRGKPGWGEMMAPFSTVMNTFGGRWYDPQWRAQLTSPQVEQAASFYVDLVRAHGEPGAAQAGFSECGTQFGQGNVAMWYDATSAAGTVENPEESTVVGKVGFAPAPVVATPSSGWLYSWALGIPVTSPRPDAAWQFMSWMTNKQYAARVGTDPSKGWSSAPPGARLSTYADPRYQQAASAFAPTVLDAISRANPRQPTVDPVPYQGVQFVRIPEFQDLGTRVSQQLSAAIAGRISTREALEQSQTYAETVGESYQ